MWLVCLGGISVGLGEGCCVLFVFFNDWVCGRRLFKRFVKMEKDVEGLVLYRLRVVEGFLILGF